MTDDRPEWRIMAPPTLERQLCLPDGVLITVTPLHEDAAMYAVQGHQTSQTTALIYALGAADEIGAPLPGRVYKEYYPLVVGLSHGIEDAQRASLEWVLFMLSAVTDRVSVIPVSRQAAASLPSRLAALVGTSLACSVTNAITHAQVALARRHHRQTRALLQSLAMTHILPRWLASLDWGEPVSPPCLPHGPIAQRLQEMNRQLMLVRQRAKQWKTMGDRITDASHPTRKNCELKYLETVRDTQKIMDDIAKMRWMLSTAPPAAPSEEDELVFLEQFPVDPDSTPTLTLF